MLTHRAGRLSRVASAASQKPALTCLSSESLAKDRIRESETENRQESGAKKIISSGSLSFREKICYQVFYERV